MYLAGEFHEVRNSGGFITGSPHWFCIYTSVKGEAESSDVQLGLFLALNPIHTFLKNADRAPDFLILQVRNQENERD